MDLEKEALKVYGEPLSQEVIVALALQYFERFGRDRNPGSHTEHGMFTNTYMDGVETRNRVTLRFISDEGRVSASVFQIYLKGIAEADAIDMTKIYDRTKASLLCIFGGIFGAHKFYENRYGAIGALIRACIFLITLAIAQANGGMAIILAVFCSICLIVKGIMSWQDLSRIRRKPRAYYLSFKDKKKLY